MSVIAKRIQTIWLFTFILCLFAPSSSSANTADSAQSARQPILSDRLQISSLIFLNATRNMLATRGVANHDFTNLVLDRGYINLRYRINDKWRSRITTNIIADSNQPGQKAHAYIKYANLTGTFSPALKLVIGLQHTPWIHYEQILDRHRYITRCFINSNELDHSADAGLGIKGRLLGNRLEYWLTEIEGGGYKELKYTQSADFNGRIGFYPEGPAPATGWTLDVQYRNGFLGKNLPGTLNASRHILYQTMATYTYDNTFRIATGYLAQHQNHYDNQANNNSDIHAYYFWGWYKLPRHISAYCRYEFKQQDNTRSTTAEKKFRYVLALDYSPSKHLTLALAWDHTAYDNLGLTPHVGQYNNNFGLYSRFRF